MRRSYLLWVIIPLFFALPLLFAYLTFTNSKDCSQLVIDTYEVYSGINIPNVHFANCYYDQSIEIRISVYDLKGEMDYTKFKAVNKTEALKYLPGLYLLTDKEHPQGEKLYLARGKYGTRSWTFIVDKTSKRLWAALKYS